MPNSESVLDSHVAESPRLWSGAVSSRLLLPGRKFSSRPLERPVPPPFWGIGKTFVAAGGFPLGSPSLLQTN